MYNYFQHLLQEILLKLLSLPKFLISMDFNLNSDRNK